MLAALLVIPIGATLVYLGAPQLVATLLQYRAAALLTLPADGRGPSADDIRSAILNLDEADRWWDDPANSLDGGILLMRLAAPSSGQRRLDPALLKEAEQRFQRSLAEAPANARAWAALADARRLEGASSTAAAALNMSMQLARFEPSLLAWRCEIGLALYQVLDDQAKAELDTQIRLLGRHSVEDLIRLARASGRIGVVITALGSDVETLGQFERRLRTIK